MLGFIFPIAWKILEWALVTALVLTYIEIGAGGDSLNAIVLSIKDVLIDIQWGELAHNISGHVQNLLTHLWDGFQNNDVAQNNTAFTQCTETLKECQSLAQTYKNK